MIELLRRLACKLFFINHNYEEIKREIYECSYSDGSYDVVTYKCTYCKKMKKVDKAGNKYTIGF